MPRYGADFADSDASCRDAMRIARRTRYAYKWNKYQSRFENRH